MGKTIRREKYNQEQETNVREKRRSRKEARARARRALFAENYEAEVLFYEKGK